MRVVIPCEDYRGLAAQRSGHFGHAPWLTIVDVDDDGRVLAVHAVRNAEHGEGGCGNVIAHVLGLEADVIIVAGMGMRPYTAFTQNGVAVYVDRELPVAEDALKQYLSGTASPMSPDDACRH